VHTSKTLKRIFIVACAVVVIFFALYTFTFWYMNSGVFGAEVFEKETWHATTTNEEDATCYRGGMAKDIIDKVLSSSMNNEDVAILLGAPARNSTNQEYQYALGMCSGFGFDYDNLHIYFDEQGRFSRAKIIQH
jgi:hypothetical protein